MSVNNEQSGKIKNKLPLIIISGILLILFFISYVGYKSYNQKKEEIETAQSQLVNNALDKLKINQEKPADVTENKTDDNPNNKNIELTNVSLVQKVVSNGDADALTLLIKTQDINVNDIVYDDFGYDLLDYSLAVMEPKAEIVDIIIKSGADVNRATKNNGMRPLHIITQRSDIPDPVDIVRLLINAGADVNATDDNGRYAIVQTVLRGNVESFKLLVNAGADLNVKNTQGYTLPELAVMKKVNTNDLKYDEIINILKNNMVNN